jgi:GNAT superfamily N-acetyltransferase
VDITIVQTQPEHAEALAGLQAACFPGLPPEDYFTADHYRSHVRVFPEGQFVALADGQVVGATTTMRTHFDPVPQHYIPFIGHNWLTTHEPDGVWLYGIDMSVHPDYRRRGIARRFYGERAALVRRLGLRGELVAGLLPGYDQHRDMSIEAYAAAVVAGTLTDPTLTPQLRIGLRFVRLLYDYVTDSRSDNVATLLTRANEASTSLTPAER